MKKILLLVMCCPLMLAAQNGNGVTVNGLDVKPGTVTFNVSWRNTGMPALWSDSVWVFVDYNKAGKMERLPVTSATATAGTVTKVQGNDKGVWVIGDARSAGNFSATVKLHTATADLYGICAYASNYPPVGEYTEANKIKFTGTPPYNLVLGNAGSGTHTYSINDNYYNLYEGETLQSFTDKTGAPGSVTVVLYAIPPSAVSAATWSFGPQTWSDRIQVAPSNCSLVPALSASSLTSEYINHSGVYYYNWHCVANNQAAFCPFPWHVPTISDFNLLATYTTRGNIVAIWPATGFIRSATLSFPALVYITAADLGPDGAPRFFETGDHWPTLALSEPWAATVRCVK
jgi:hypothetical protein